MKAFDTAVESLENVDIKTIKSLVDKRKLKYKMWTSKEDLIKMLCGETVVEDEKKDLIPETKPTKNTRGRPKIVKKNNTNLA
jgi:hypothetical protein